MGLPDLLGQEILDVGPTFWLCKCVKFSQLKPVLDLHSPR